MNKHMEVKNFGLKFCLNNQMLKSRPNAELKKSYNCFIEVKKSLCSKFFYHLKEIVKKSSLVV